jgi:hypothetical protein
MMMMMMMMNDAERVELMYKETICCKVEGRAKQRCKTVEG